MAERLRGHRETIAQRLERDLAAFQRPLPPAYYACEKVATRASSLSLVRYRLNDYSVPMTYGHRDVLVRGYVHEVVISGGAEVIARHPRSYERHVRTKEAVLRRPPHGCHQFEAPGARPSLLPGGRTVGQPESTRRRPSRSAL